MKKKFLYGIVAFGFGALLLTGCGGSSNKVVCSGDFKEGGQKIASGEIAATLDDSDKVKDVSATMTFEDEQTATAYQQLMEEFGSSGLGIKATRSGKKVTISNYDVLSSSAEDSLVGVSKADFIKAMESDGSGLSCK